MDRVHAPTGALLARRGHIRLIVLILALLIMLLITASAAAAG